MTTLRGLWAALRQDARLHTPLVFFIAAYLAFANRFLQDDAFISFRYAQNFANGLGLVWNSPAERVEGYTNFLWTVLMSLAFPLHIEVSLFSQMVSGACFLGTLSVTYLLARKLLPTAGLASLAILLLGTNYTFSAYATGGLETALQTLLFNWVVWEALRLTEDPPRLTLALVAFSLLGSLALLTRLDSAVLLAAPGLQLLWHLTRRPAHFVQRGGWYLAMSAPLLLVLAAWFGWRHAFYDAWLPNTFLVKVASVSPALRGLIGLIYLSEFIQSYQLVFPLGLLLVLGQAVGRDAPGRWLVVSVGLWVAYVVLVGGDFMEFRFLVPVLPLGAVLFVRAWHHLPTAAWKNLFVAGVLIGSVSHAVMFGARNPAGGPFGIESIDALNRHIAAPDNSWPLVGQVFHTLFYGSTPVVQVAVKAAGAIPYYAQLPAVDMLGLNDRWVAQYGAIGFRPGHQRMAPLAYLVERQVTLVVGDPQIEPLAERLRRDYQPADLGRFGITVLEGETLPSVASVLEIPLNARYKITVLYLTPNPTVDHLIQERQWVVYPVQQP